MTLIDLLATPAYRDLSDEDALALASVPIKTPRPDPITWTTLNGSNIWGFTKTAAFKATLRAVIGAGGENGAAADNLFGMLDGGGLHASDPQAPSMAPAFVAMGNGTVTDDDAAKALYSSITYPAGGTAPPALEDIQAARAKLATILPLRTLREQVSTFADYAGPAIDQLLSRAGDGETVSVPTLAELLASFEGAE
jgi:hypothetical protein